MQHGLEVCNVVQQLRHEAVQLPALAQQQLGSLHMLLLQHHTQVAARKLSENVSNMRLSICVGHDVQCCL